MHAAFYDEKTPPEEWKQTAKHQINFLDELNEYFPVRNGYVMLQLLPKNDRSTFFKESTPEYDNLMGKLKIGYHKNVQVTSNNNYYIWEPNQHIDQVFCAGNLLKL